MKTLKIPITKLANIKKLIPHREPMIMVDSLLKYEEGTATVGFTILKNNVFVSNDELSETGLIEHMAQAAAVYIGFKNHIDEQSMKEGFIASIKKLSIKKLPKADQIITTQVTIIHEVMHMTTVNLSTFSNQVEIANAQMNTVLKIDQ